MGEPKLEVNETSEVINRLERMEKLIAKNSEVGHAPIIPLIMNEEEHRKYIVSWEPATLRRKIRSLDYPAKVEGNRLYFNRDECISFWKRFAGHERR